MKALVTGATGKVGHATVRALLADGHEVVALVRDVERARAVMPEGAELVAGDVTDPASLERACQGCEVVFNAMGLPEQWLRDETVFDRVNARGSENVALAARRAGVRRLVHTSTIDVFHAEPGARFDESRVADYPKPTAYERSKQRAEELVWAAAGDELEVVMTNPAAVYGPGPMGSASPERAIFEPVVRKRLPALTPGGFGVVFSDGVGRGQVLAAERGRPGERYILCDGHTELRELAELVVQLAGRGRVPPVLPVPLARAMAAAGEGVARLIRRPPLLPRGQLSFLLWNAKPDSSKAQRELGWEPTPIEDGVRRTLAEMGLLRA
jgi:nucleoside-diphosphate-sugar epimerase